MPESDKNLIAAYDAYADPIFRFCSFMLSDRERALELMQETFVKTLEYHQKGNAIDEMRPFLYMVARNLCRNEISRKPHNDSIDELAESGTEFADVSLPSPETTADLKLLRERIEGLPPNMREVLVMRHIDGLPVKEISVILQESENIISVRIHRALKELRTRFNSRI